MTPEPESAAASVTVTGLLTYPVDQPEGVPVAVVTGATGAIGSATAEQLLRSGWTVALLGRDAQRVHELAHHFGIDDDRLDEMGWA